MRTPDEAPGLPAPPDPSSPPTSAGTDLFSDGVWSPTDPAPVIRGTRADRHRKRGGGSSKALLIILAVTALAAGLRLWHLSSPHAYVFDEVYYAKDGCYDAGYPYKDCDLEQPGEQTFTVHPPLGRWIIAGFEKTFGNRPFGWRIGSAVFGTLSVLLVSLIALQLFDSPWWAGVAGLLLATEGLNLVQSRVSMLDIYVTTFLLAGFLFLLLDRKWIERRTPEAAPVGSIVTEELDMPPERVPSPLWRPWRLAAGAALGAAAATKWSGFLGLLAVIALSLVWERGRRKRARIARPWWGSIRDETFGILVFLLLVPLAVYLVSYARWFMDNGVDLAAWWKVQTGMLDYSIHLRATHPYASSAVQWLFMTRPVSYYYACTGHVGGVCTGSAEILALGNPLIFWGTLVTIPIVVILGVLRRDWIAGFIATAFFVQYLPWLAVARTSFLFYMTPLTPFMVLALIYCLRSLVTATETEQGGVTFGLVVAGGIVLLSVGLFAFFWPVLIGEHISQAAWSMRIWFCRGGGHCLFNWV